MIKDIERSELMDLKRSLEFEHREALRFHGNYFNIGKFLYNKYIKKIAGLKLELIQLIKRDDPNALDECRFEIMVTKIKIVLIVRKYGRLQVEL